MPRNPSVHDRSVYTILWMPDPAHPCFGQSPRELIFMASLQLYELYCVGVVFYIIVGIVVIIVDF